jgi:hypothetical protein
MDGEANRSIKDRDRKRGHHVKDEEWKMGIYAYVSYNAEEPNAEIFICYYLPIYPSMYPSIYLSIHLSIL